MSIALSSHMTYKKLFKLTIAPILMMVFVSIYGVVDGFCITTFCKNNDVFAGVNVIMPVVMIIGGIGFMMGAGGSALIGKLLGEQNKERASQIFTQVIIFASIIGIILSFVGFLTIKPIAEALGKITNGTTQGMVDNAIIYGRIIMCSQLFFILQYSFQSFFMVNEKPMVGFIFTIAAGVTNMVLDFLFIGVFKWEAIGAASATMIGQMVGSIGPFIYFVIKGKNLNVHFVKTRLEFAPLFKVISNGCSEFVNNIASSIVGVVFNIQLLRYYGQNGVSAYGTIMYVGFIFVSIFIGYSTGVAPVISYNYGAKNNKELKNVLTKSFIIVLLMSISMFLLSEILSHPLAILYGSNIEELIKLTTLAMRIYSICYLLCGLSIFASNFFTALNNGVVSAVISFLRTLVFQLAFAFVLPLIIGEIGIWFAVVLSEVLALILSLVCIAIFKKKYGY